MDPKQRCKGQLLLTITEMVNVPLTSGKCPNEMRKHLVKTLTKTTLLDQAENYRLISNLGFAINVNERAVTSQLESCLSAYNLDYSRQIGLRITS